MIRDETEADLEVVGALITEAFRTAPHVSGTEAEIVAALRRAGALTLGLVAAEGEAVVGYAAVSPVLIDGADRGWFALGPVAVRPDRQGRGIGAALTRESLRRLRARGARGCAVVGEPGYYGRFGFKADPRLRMEGVPPEFVLALAFADEPPGGRLVHHPAFGLERPEETG